MTEFRERMFAEWRRIVLEALAEDAGYQSNENSLKMVLAHFGHTVGRDEVRAQLGYLERHGLVRVEKLPCNGGELFLVTLTPDGQDVARGVTHEGVARRAPRG